MPAGNDGDMTQTIAIIANAVLATGVAAVLAFVMHVPYRLRRHRAAPHVVYAAGAGERELSRAA